MKIGKSIRKIETYIKLASINRYLRKIKIAKENSVLGIFYPDSMLVRECDKFVGLAYDDRRVMFVVSNHARNVSNTVIDVVLITKNIRHTLAREAIVACAEILDILNEATIVTSGEMSIDGTESPCVLIKSNDMSDVVDMSLLESHISKTIEQKLKYIINRALLDSRCSS